MTTPRTPATFTEDEIAGLLQKVRVTSKRADALEQQNKELVAAALAFIKYDENDHSDGVMMMIDYAEARRLARAAMKSVGAA